MRNVSRASMGVFWVVIVAMVGLAIFALANRQPAPGDLTEAQLEQTVDAGVAMRLTAGAPTPNINQTIEARVNAELTATATPTLIPPPTSAPSIVDQVVGGESFIGSIWGFFGRLGWLIQGICCIVLPGLVLLGILNDPRRK